MSRIKLYFFLVISVVLFIQEANAQDYFVHGGQINLSGDGDDCQFKSSNHSLFSALTKETGNCTFTIPVVAFQIKDQKAKAQFMENCFSAADFPTMTFEGRFLNFSLLSEKENGVFPIKLEGHWHINGERIPLSENVEIYKEGEQYGLSFNTEVNLLNMKLDIDLVLNYRRRIQGE